jgi:glycosyltransferase involved in cell wall biosynthesis
MRILLWHVHGSYTTSLVQGDHDYFIPTLPSRGAYGLGRARTWDWPRSVREVSPSQAADADIDLVILQRPEELTGLAESWLGGRRPGIEVPAIYLEHNAPQGRINDLIHPAADRDDLLIVHVTHFNSVFWDTGSTPTRVVEHGIVDPGYRGPGPSDHAVAVINEPVRRARVTGTDLLADLAARSGVPVDVFGMRSEPIGGHDVPQDRLHAEMAARRVYLHPIRWTSLGLSLLEAMHLGLPVVALATTAVGDAVPAEAGVVSNDLDVLAAGLRRFAGDPEEAAMCGKAGREAALARFGLRRFLSDWNELFAEAVS